MSTCSRRVTQQTTVLAATRRDGAIWAHLFVGSPRNIDILLRALLLDLHPTSPPSHTCLVMKQVPGVSRAGYVAEDQLAGAFRHVRPPGSGSPAIIDHRLGRLGFLESLPLPENRPSHHA